MRTFFLLRVTPSFLKSLLEYKVSLVIYKRFNNFVLIINVVTVFNLFIF